MENASKISADLEARRDPEKSVHTSRYFKCGPGQYGEGDIFLGVSVPVVRETVRRHSKGATTEDVLLLTSSHWHEERLAGFLLLIEIYRRRLKDPKGDVHELMEFYHRIIPRGNNWDLVDLAAPYLLGDYLLRHPMHAGTMVMQLSMSGNLWKERAAVVATLPSVRKGEFEVATEQCRIHLGHTHDLMHKAVGWVLREIGKKDEGALTTFLRLNAHEMHRTTLRYAIERLSPEARKSWLAVKRTTEQK